MQKSQGSNRIVQTGAKQRIPTKGSGMSKVTDRFFENKLILPEDEKEADDFKLLKQNILVYEQKGRRIISANRKKIIKNQNIANGVIEKADYVPTSDFKDELSLIDNLEDDSNLEFFPLAPKIVNTLSAFLSKTKVGYSVIATNREAQNEILERKNTDIRNLLVGSAMKFFEEDLANQGITEESQPDIYQEQLKIFQNLPKIQKYYNTDFRLTVEEWANHTMENVKRKFNMVEIEKELFRNKIINDRPYFHINLMEGSVRPEVLRQENCAYLKSPHNDDVSSSYMFMWYEYESPENIIQRFGDQLTNADMEKLHLRFGSTNFTATTYSNYDFETKKPIEADIQNFLAFRTEEDTTHRHRGDEYRDRLVEVMNMYVQVPRMLKKVTLKYNGVGTTSVVDEKYVPIFKPVYMKGKPKTAEFLVEGEHVDPFYINELWRVSKLNFSRNANPELSDDVWLKLEKYPVQLSDPKVGRYGSYIPVHGGPTTNKYSESSSVIDKAATWQIAFNFIWNRVMQILQTEIGPFFIMNQNAIPTESIDGSWGKFNFLKFALAARDVGIAPVDTSPANMGGSGSQLTGGFGQKVDMSRMDEILQKIQLAEMIKNECYSVIGLTPQFMAEVSPNETSSGITQGIQRSITAIKDLFDEHYCMMEKSWQTILELSKFVKINEGSSEDTYINSEGERQIFQTDTENFPLYMLGVYTTSSFDDTLLIAEMKQMVRMDNTMGADLEDKISMLSSHSMSEIHKSLKELNLKKQQQLEQQQQQEQQLTQAKIEADERNKQAELAWAKEKVLLELESAENIAEMKVIGQSNLAQGTGLDDLLKYKQSEMAEKSYYQDILDRARDSDNQRDLNRDKINSKREEALNKASVESEKLQVKREEIMARLQVSQNQLKIAKENKP